MTTPPTGASPEAPRAGRVPGPRRARRGAALGDLAAGFGVTMASAAATWWLASPPASHLIVAAVLYVPLAALVLRGVPSDPGGPGVGPANRVTLGRAALAVPLFALAFQGMRLDSIAAWWVIALSTVVLVLDGVDGRVARRTRSSSTFGARFDMELDASLILALSVLVWLNGRAGAWVLLIGLMRYAFVAAGWAWPALRAELPASVRRKVVCVVQGVVLLVALGPIIPDVMATGVLLGGLVALVYSFATDVRWALGQT